MRNTAKKATVRLSDIAKETGYSLSTVSKALNGRADVSEETRQTINAVLKRYGYSRKATSTKSQRIIEIVFQDFDNVWALEVLRGAIREAKLHDLNVITTEGGNRQHPDSSWIDNMLRRQTDGAILVFSSLTRIERNKLHSRGIPFVLFDPFGNPDPDTLSVQADNWTGGVIATRHLLALGHTRIGIITGPEEMMCSKARLDGYTSALAEHGIKTDPELITEAISPLPAVTRRPSHFWKGRIVQPQSSPAAICRPWASTRRQDSWDYVFPRIYPWSDSTMCRLPHSLARR